MRKMSEDDLERINLDEDMNYDDSYLEEAIKDETENKQDKMTAKDVVKEILMDSLYILVVLLVTLLVIKYVGQRTVVIGSSMVPTLEDQNSLIVDKISYRFKDPERFDIIVFPFEYEKDTHYIKRIIGLPGETVRIDTLGNIFINGEILEENYGAEVIDDPGLAINEITIGENQYFVLGDNRNHSSDSRTQAVGLIEKDKIVGKAIVRIYPFDEMGKLK